MFINCLNIWEVDKILTYTGNGGKIANWLASNIPILNLSTAMEYSLFNLRHISQYLYGSASSGIKWAH